MKKLLFILPLFFFSLTVNAQQTEDDIYVGKSKTFGNYKGTDIKSTKQIKGSPNVTGTVVKVGMCKEDCMTILVKKDDGNTISVGTKNNGFTVPKDIVGKRINIEGYASVSTIRDKKKIKDGTQENIQFVATGMKLYDKKE